MEDGDEMKETVAKTKFSFKKPLGIVVVVAWGIIIFTPRSHIFNSFCSSWDFFYYS